MIEQIISWISFHYMETIASIIGVFSIYFGIKEKPFFWILATINAILFVYVYFQAKMYAVMLLQLYYITVGIYGFYYWIKGQKKENVKKVLITRISKRYAINSSILFILIYFLITFILKKFTNSPIPFGDSLISTASIFAVFFMMKKYIESWYIWIVSDVITIFILFSQNLYGAATLQSIYFIFAIIGLIEWKKSLKSQEILVQKKM